MTEETKEENVTALATELNEDKDADNPDADKMYKEVQKLKDDCASLRSEINTLEGTLTTVQSQLKMSNERNAKLENVLNPLVHYIKDQGTENDNMEEQISNYLENNEYVNADQVEDIINESTITIEDLDISVDSVSASISR